MPCTNLAGARALAAWDRELLIDALAEDMGELLIRIWWSGCSRWPLGGREHATPPKAALAPPAIPPRQLTSRDLAAEQKDQRRYGSPVGAAGAAVSQQRMLLAEQAARRREPLVARFIELGRRYQKTLKAP